MECLKTYGTINHAVTLIGYGAYTNGTEYWIIKNSWDTWWGDKGYCKMKIGACDSDRNDLYGSIYDTCSSYNGNPTECNKHNSCSYCSTTNTCLLITETCAAPSGPCWDSTNNRYYPTTHKCYTPGADELCAEASYCTGSSAECPSAKLKAKGTVCRAAVGDCDKAEVCTGTSKTCPANEFKSKGTVCRAAAGACDITETCTGSSAECPKDSVRPKGYVCRAAASSECDIAETCDGVSVACPANAVMPTTKVCRSAQSQCEQDSYCTAEGACEGVKYKSIGASCDDGDSCTTNDVCDGKGSCSGKMTCACVSDEECKSPTMCQTGACVEGSCKYTDVNNIVCRPANGACDIPEYCTNGLCPEDKFDQTCLDDAKSSQVKNGGNKSFPTYAIIMIVVGCVIFVLVAGFVVYRIKKNNDELATLEDFNAAYDYPEGFNKPDAPQPPPAVPPRQPRFSLRRPISVRVPPQQRARPAPPVPQGAPGQAPRLPPRAARISVRARPISTRMAPPQPQGRRPMPLPSQQGNPRGGRPLPNPQAGRPLPNPRAGRPLPNPRTGRPLPNPPGN